jgi:hypothetical protein
MCKPDVKRPLGRCRHRWNNNIKEIGWVGIEYIRLAQDRYQWRALVDTVMNLRVPQNFEKFLSG